MNEASAEARYRDYYNHSAGDLRIHYTWQRSISFGSSPRQLARAAARECFVLGEVAGVATDFCFCRWRRIFNELDPGLELTVAVTDELYAAREAAGIED